MNVALKLGLFLTGMAAVFGAAAALGNSLEPIGSTKPDAMQHDAMTMPTDRTPGGLQAAENGYRLILDEPSQQPNAKAPVSFKILGPDGEPLMKYATLHDKKLHLIVAKRDLTGFQHVHPTLADDGTWSADVALDPGQWRVFADFDPAGKDEQLTLGTDLSVAGDFNPKELPAPSHMAKVDGYTVMLDGDVAAGKQSKLTLSVEKDGEPVTDLEPYLAAYGHLVALRAGDLAYLHVHPEGEPGDGKTKPGPSITFFAEVPSAGSYRLYLDFKHGGVVRTAEFTVATDGSAKPMDEPTTEHGH
jgi:hypothetical protein